MLYEKKRGRGAADGVHDEGHDGAGGAGNAELDDRVEIDGEDGGDRGSSMNLDAGGGADGGSSCSTG